MTRLLVFGAAQATVDSLAIHGTSSSQMEPSRPVAHGPGVSGLGLQQEGFEWKAELSILRSLLRAGSMRSRLETASPRK